MTDKNKSNREDIDSVSLSEFDSFLDKNVKGEIKQAILDDTNVLFDNDEVEYEKVDLFDKDDSNIAIQASKKI